MSRPLVCVGLMLSALVSVAADTGWLKYVSDADRARTNPYAKQTDAIAGGARLFQDHCAKCHGEDALGRGKRPSLRTKEVQRATDGQLFSLLKNGYLKKGMPSWSALPEPSRWQIIAYVKSLGEQGTLSRGAGDAPTFPSEVESTPAEDSIGDRWFLDTRFGQFFAANMTGVNQPLPAGDPSVDLVYTTNGTLPGPFAGQSINRRSCHFVPEFQGVAGAGNRTYVDYTTRSPLPRMLTLLTTLQETPCRWWDRCNPVPGRYSCTLMASSRTQSIWSKAR